MSDPKTDHGAPAARGTAGQELGRAAFPRRGSNVVHFIADYAPGDLAITEVIDALYDTLPETFKVVTTSVASFKTTETGFVLGQLALKPRPADGGQRIFFVNCAPRQDKRASRANNEGEGLVLGRLSNGNLIVAVNSKYSLSLVRDHFESLNVVQISNAGSQFRSRDNYPAVVGAVASGDFSEYIGRELDPQKDIPQFEEGYIGYVDSFGNIKTTFRETGPLATQIKDNSRRGKPQHVLVHCNGNHHQATVTDGSFKVPEGGIAFSLGSSGWDNRFWEVFMRGHRAHDIFQKPAVGSRIEIELRENGGS